jgi:PAS domain S-box-containing protein
LSKNIEPSTLRALIEAASQGVLVIRDDGSILLVNEKTEELFGYSRVELLTMRVDDLLPEGAREAHGRYVADFFRSPRKRPMGMGMELSGRRRDGTGFPVEVSLSYVDEGSRRLALALITDISDRKRLEERSLEAQRLETAGLLASGVAHDFNNLLVGILGNGSLILDAMSPDDPSRELMDSLMRASEKAAELTRQLLAYAGKARFVPRPLDISKLFHEMHPMLMAAVPPNVDLQVTAGSGLPDVHADASQIKQVIMSLITNAVESIPAGRRGKITVHVHQAGSQVCVQVQDNGAGMDAEMQSRIFDPFFTTKFLGRGLGLSAALGIVRSHRGSIEVESAAGEGSTFSILLPAIVPAAERSDRAPLAGGPPGARLVLVVDDEEVVRNLARVALERHGYMVLTAENGQEALEIFQQERNRISLVLLDLTMPVMGGEETLAGLKKLRPDVPVLLSSGYSEWEAMRLFGAKGLTGFIQKPYPPSRLVETLRSALESANQ